jgi:hypothetical protein
MNETALQTLAREIVKLGGSQAGSAFKAAPHAGTADANPSTPYNYGPGGLFGTYGLSRELISLRVQPRGLASVLPVYPSMQLYPFFGYISGFNDVTGTNKDGVCDDPQTAGATVGCLQTAVFGRYEFQTRTLEVNRLGQQINRGEYQDLVILNDPLYQPQAGLVNPGQAFQQSLNREISWRFGELAVAFQNKLTRQIWKGNPANNTHGGGYKEFPGLDILIGTGKKDAETGTTCPNLDSLIIDYKYGNLTSTTSYSGGGILNVLQYTMRMLQSRAMQTGLDPVNWALVMREELFYELAAVWPCTYMTTNCTLPDNSSPTVMAGDQIAMRDDMRQNQYLIVDGIRYNVIFDSALTENSSGTVGVGNVPAGQLASDIYIIPLTAMGGSLATTYWQYYDYSGPNAVMSQLGDGQGLASEYWTDSGRYMFHFKTAINWCVQWIAKMEPRILLRTPQLAARIKNVRYSTLMHPNDAYSDQPYFQAPGGVSGRTAPSTYAEWHS